MYGVSCNFPSSALHHHHLLLEVGNSIYSILNSYVNCISNSGELSVGCDVPYASWHKLAMKIYK